MLEKFIGKVSYYKNEHGFGYAETTINQQVEKVYLHFTQMNSIEFNNNIQIGDMLEFEVTTNLRNGLSAENIKAINEI